MDYKILRLTDRPELKEQAVRWFHEKWGIPLEAYMESMEECLEEKGPVPQWYMALDGERIIGGMGVIENDFHDRKDLAPNVCAVYTEEDWRGRGALTGQRILGSWQTWQTIMYAMPSAPPTAPMRLWPALQNSSQKKAAPMQWAI